MRELGNVRYSSLLFLALVTPRLFSPNHRPPQAPPNIDPKAEALLNAAVSRLQRAKSFSASTRLIEYGPTGGPYSDGGRIVRALGKTRMRVSLEYLHGTGVGQPDSIRRRRITRVIGDGGATTEISPWDSLANRRAIEHGMPLIVMMMLDAPLAPYYLDPRGHTIHRRVWLPSRRSDPTLRELAVEQPTHLDGQQVEVVRWVTLYMQGGAPQDSLHKDLPPSQREVFDTTRFYISVGTDTLIRKVVSSTSQGSKEELTFEEFQLDPAIGDSAFTLPPTVRVRSTRPAAAKVGQRFPDFRLLSMTPAGDTLYETLETMLAGKKAGLIWLWASL
jgi:hypothetical protein